MSDGNFAGVFSTLYAGDRLIAAHFGIRTSDLLHWWFPSYDLDLAKFGPGKSLVNFCAAASGEQGLTTIDFGKGDEDFKLLFGDCEVQLAEGSLARPGSLAGVTRAITDRLVAGAEHLPLGKFRAYPRKAVARLISGVALGECA
jgi:CelD/BcsL family acetyltransferase involved in cellulose biosynthesis